MQKKTWDTNENISSKSRFVFKATFHMVGYLSKKEKKITSHEVRKGKSKLVVCN